MRRFARSCAALATLAALIASGDSRAHAVLVDSSPRNGAAVRPAPPYVPLRFNVRIEQSLARATLQSAGGAPRALTPQPGAAGHAEQVLIPLPALGAGEYELRYRVLATDGHTTFGALRFRVLP
ncbi:MAG TPA: copper resistance CopC family protein [Casimicrobiaceae bacterium]|nr:copper resistance CopC family protein [Casimicrobiaceae bacterium]